MIIYKEVTETRTEKIPISFVCDICKKEYDIKKDFLETQEFHHIRLTGGYSSVFGDGMEIECDICQHCLYKLIEKYYRKVYIND